MSEIPSDLSVYPDLIIMDPGHLVYGSWSLSICRQCEFHRAENGFIMNVS